MWCQQFLEISSLITHNNLLIDTGHNDLFSFPLFVFIKMSDLQLQSEHVDMSSLPSVPSHIPSMDVVVEGASVAAVQNETPLEHPINRRMKYKNCVMIAMKHFFIEEDVVDNYGDYIIPSLTVLEGPSFLFPTCRHNCSTVRFDGRPLPCYQFHSMLKICECSILNK